MHCVDLIASAVPDEHVPELPEEPSVGICAVTGAETDTISSRHLLSASFTQWDMLVRPDSERVGINVWRAWNYGWREDGKKRDYRPERMSSWIAAPDGLHRLTRQQVREAVLSGCDWPRWAGYATTSYKKHGSLLAPVNSSGRAVWLWEITKVDCSDLGRVHEMWDRLREYQDAGIPRPVLETAEPEPYLIAKVGIDTAQSLYDFAKPVIQSPLYQFMCYLLPSAQELKEVERDE